jgi:NAD-dependent DNA ligase
LGIRNIGEETAIDLAKYFGNLTKIKDAKLEDFDAISNIGPVVSKSVFEWLQEKENIKYLYDNVLVCQNRQKLKTVLCPYLSTLVLLRQLRLCAK